MAVNTIIEERTVRDLIPEAEGLARAGHRRVSVEQDRRLMKIISSRDSRAVDRLLRPIGRRRPRDEIVGRRHRLRRAGAGDKALLSYARKFDNLDGPLEVSKDEIEEGAARVPPRVRAAIAAAAKNIHKVARRQRPQGWRMATQPGVVVEQRVTPLDRVGCYVPGGRYPLPSSLLMTAIPARAAGVPEVIVACPRPAPIVMAAARAAGVTRLFRMGGAHAIAALAYGTGTVPRVDKIVGPGQPVRRGREGACRGRLRHRLLRRAHRDRDRRRRRHS